MSSVEQEKEGYVEQEGEKRERRELVKEKKGERKGGSRE